MLVHPLYLRKIINNVIINGIIAPHGITDLLHAQQNNYLPKLYKINILSVLTSLICHKVNRNILNGMFILSSIIHFRHDMPKIMNFPRFIMSSFLIFGFFFLKLTFFLFYMCVIHVPNHYKMSWNFLKKNKVSFFFTTFVSTLLFLNGGDYFDNYLHNSLVFSIIKSLIISHIIYGELFIHLSKNERYQIKNELIYRPIQYYI